MPDFREISPFSAAPNSPNVILTEPTDTASIEADNPFSCLESCSKIYLYEVASWSYNIVGDESDEVLFKLLEHERRCDCKNLCMERCVTRKYHLTKPGEEDGDLVMKIQKGRLK